MAGAWLAHDWRSGESACLPPMCPEFDSRTARHMCAEFAGSLPCSDGFSPGTPVFPFPRAQNKKTTTITTVFNLILFDLS